LAADVGDGLAGGQVAGQREGEGDGRVEVGPGEMAGCVDHRHDRQAEDEGDAHRAERAGVLGLVTIAPQPAKTSVKAPIASAAARRPRLGRSLI